MMIQALRLANFRNFERLELTLPPGPNVLYGENGAGKSNLLEAIFVLCLGRSQRGAADQVLVRNEAEVYRVDGTVRIDGYELPLAVAYQKGGRKKITIDNAPARVIDMYERFCVVSVGPEDSAIIAAGPSNRRGFLDLYLSQYSRTYLSDLTDYHRVLAQKNAALRQGMEHSAFNELLVKYGARVMLARNQFIALMKDPALEYYHTIARRESFDLSYQPSVNGYEAETTEQYEQMLQAKLNQVAERERYAGVALAGPHRDEVGISIAGYPARTHGSQGQWRLAAIALKLAVYKLIKEKRDMAPVLLLDEIFAELDPKRSQALIEAFGNYHQLFLTTAARPPEALAHHSRQYRIHDGQIEEIH